MLELPSFELFTSGSFFLVLKIVYYSAFIWLPLFLFFTLWDLWLTYRRAQFFASQTHILLEVKLPKEISKSPLAMELFLNGLYQTGGEGTWVDVYWYGKTRPWFSLELVSINGAVHFFIWTRKGFRNLIEANLYSQFPGIEIYEAADYTLPVSFNPAEVGLWATEFELTKPDPFPIKTYVDYGMDKDPKEEFKIDPMTPLIEFLGSIGHGHQVWIQILIRAHKAEDVDLVTGKSVDLRWAKGAEKAIEEVLKRSKPKKTPDGKEEPGRQPTEGEKEIVGAIERSISKAGFDVGIRALYIAPKDIFSSANNAGIVGGFRNYNSNNLNGFKGARVPGAKYPWQDRSKKKTNMGLQLMLDAYKQRGYFYNEYKRPYFVLNTEELATIYHFPGGVSSTPTFQRIGSKKAEAPSNLPV